MLGRDDDGADCKPRHRYRGNRPPREPIVDDRDHVRYEDDYVARVFRKMHPEGATLEIVGAMFDLTRERIRQIEEQALGKLRPVCEAEGIDIAEVLRLSIEDPYE